MSGSHFDSGNHHEDWEGSVGVACRRGFQDDPRIEPCAPHMAASDHFDALRSLSEAYWTLWHDGCVLESAWQEGEGASRRAEGGRWEENERRSGQSQMKG